MFSDYADFGRRRSITRSISKAVSAPVKAITKVATAPIKIVAKVAKPIVKMPLRVVGSALGKKKMVQQDESGAVSEVYQDEYGNPITKEQYDAAVAQASQAAPVQPVMPRDRMWRPAKRPIRPMAMPELRPAGTQDLTQLYMPQAIQSNVPTVTPIQAAPQSAAAQPRPQPQMYSAPMASVVETPTSEEQMQPERPYYDEESAPIALEQPMDDQFEAQEVEDFQGYGDFGADIIDQLEKEYGIRAEEAIEAGKNYVAKIQGKTAPSNTGTVSKVTASPFGDVPNWVWLAGGVALLMLAATYKPNKR